MGGRLIDKIKGIFDQINNEKLKRNLFQHLPFGIASLIAGLVAVLYAKLFSLAERFSSFVAQKNVYLLFLVTPACFLVAWWIVKRFARNASGSGIPQVMAAIEIATPRQNLLAGKLLSLKVIVVKVISSLFMVLGGGIIGREGPTVQIAGSIFRAINQRLPESWPKISKRNMIMAGAAAGLAAAFNTPLGGIVFAVEELAKTHISNFKTALFTAVIIAGLTAQGILGPYLYLGYPEVSNLPRYIIFFVLLVVCVAGVMGSVTSVVILKLIRWKGAFRRQRQHVFYVLVSALLIVGVACFIDINMLGSGKELMSHLLFSQDKQVSYMLPLLKIVGAVASFTTGAAGGVFAPSLGIGATVGAFFAQLFDFVGPSANILILTGMVAFLTGVTRSPFTSAILVLEMTDRHSVVFYLMLAGIVGNLVASTVDRRSLYEHLEKRYLDDVTGTTHNLAPGAR